MVTRIEGHWIRTRAFSGPSTVTYQVRPYPPGTDVYACISLSYVLGVPVRNDPWDFAAYIESWAYYRQDGTETVGWGDEEWRTNSQWIENCTKITFALNVTRGEAIGQISVFVI